MVLVFITRRVIGSGKGGLIGKCSIGGILFTLHVVSGFCVWLLNAKISLKFTC